MTHEGLLDEARQLLISCMPASWPELREIFDAALRGPWPPVTALPIVVCEAAGGAAAEAFAPAAAWAALNLSLRILDDLEDQDRPNALWATIGVPRAFHVASTLREMCASALVRAPLAADIRLALLADTSASLLRVGRGQDADLRAATSGAARPDLARHWQVMADKSGELFAFACRLGARLGPGQRHMESLSSYGFHLGMALQLLDDLESVLPAGDARDLRHGRVGFPVLAACTLGSPALMTEIRALLEGPPPWDGTALHRFLAESGALDFTRYTAQQQVQRAHDALAAVERSDARSWLERYALLPFGEADRPR